MKDVITTDFTGIKRIIGIYYEQFCVNKFNNIDKMDNFLEGCK